MGQWRPTATARSAGDNGRRCFIQINTREGDPVSRGFVCFPCVKKLLGRTETHTCDRMCFQTKRSLRHLPRRSSKNCDLQFANFDRFKENYSLDEILYIFYTEYFMLDYHHLFQHYYLIIIISNLFIKVFTYTLSIYVRCLMLRFLSINSFFFLCEAL